MVCYTFNGMLYKKGSQERKEPVGAEHDCKQIMDYREVMIMTIQKTANAAELTVALTGRLDTTTAPQLESELKASIEGVETLILDFAALDYLSSAGLRVLLAAQKIMNKQGNMIVKNVNETIAEIFEVTGFADILTIE